MNTDVLRLVLTMLFVVYCFMLISQGYVIENLTMHIVGKAFVTFTVLLCLLLAADFYSKKILDRFQVAFCLFGIIGTIAYLADMSFVLYYYDNHARVLFFTSIFVVGLITTFFTKAGFIGVISDNQKAVNVASFKLLVLSGIAVFWKLYAESSWRAFLFHVIFPFNLMEFARRRWRRQLTGEKGGW